MDFNFLGLIISVGVFLLIGVFHPIVIKTEYYFSDRVWPVFLVGGIISVICSLLVDNTVGSALLGALGCSFFWKRAGSQKIQTESTSNPLWEC